MKKQESTGIPNAYQLEAETQRLREEFDRNLLFAEDLRFCAEQLRSVIDPATEVHQPPSEAAMSQSGSDHQSQADPQSEAGATHGTDDEPAETDPQDEARPCALIAKTAHPEPAVTEGGHQVMNDQTATGGRTAFSDAPRSSQTFYGAGSAAMFKRSCDEYESP